MSKDFSLPPVVHSFVQNVTTRFTGKMKTPEGKEPKAVSTEPQKGNTFAAGIASKAERVAQYFSRNEFEIPQEKKIAKDSAKKISETPSKSSSLSKLAETVKSVIKEVTSDPLLERFISLSKNNPDEAMKFFENLAKENPAAAKELLQKLMKRDPEKKASYEMLMNLYNL